MRGQLNSQSTG